MPARRLTCWQQTIFFCAGCRAVGIGGAGRRPGDRVTEVTQFPYRFILVYCSIEKSVISVTRSLRNQKIRTTSARPGPEQARSIGRRERESARAPRGKDPVRTKVVVLMVAVPLPSKNSLPPGPSLPPARHVPVPLRRARHGHSLPQPPLTPHQATHSFL